MLDIGLKVLIAYLLGAVIGSLLLGKLRGGVDIRTLGSGNAGGTNALRTQGPVFAFWVMVIDVGKGWVAAAVLPTVDFGASIDASIAPWVPIACASAVVVGHVYPIWFGFRGGKGAATLIGVVLGLSAVAAVPVMIVWLSVLLSSGYVGLATMVAAIAFPLYALWVLRSDSLLAFGIAMALFVIFTHRGNIARMRAGTENRSTRLWLLRPR